MIARLPLGARAPASVPVRRARAPTPLVDPAGPRTIPIVPVRRPESAVRLALRAVGFAIAWTWAVRVRGLGPVERATRVRAFLEELGGMWVKAGQLLSLRNDIFSRETVDQLSLLQYRSQGFDPALSRALIAQELGKPVEALFATFEDHPFAAASISQIHKATLHDGTAVVVKVQRPNIDEVLARDLRAISWLLRRMGAMPAVTYIDWDGMIRELHRMFEEEVDYRYEIANLRRMRRVLRPHKVVVPRVYRRLSSQRVIVMAYIDGVVMSDYIRVRRADPARVAAWEAENEIVPAKVGARLMTSFYRQLLEDNLFHGDLHPGNILLLRKNRFALIDFGTIGNLDARFVKLYRQQAAAFVVGDYAKAIDTYLLLADTIPPMDLDDYRADFTEAARAWEARTHLEGLTYLERSLTGGIANALADLNRKYKVNLSWQFLRVGRSISTMDANLSTLLGDKNPNKILRDYFVAERRRALRGLVSHGLGQLGAAVLDVRDTYGYVADNLRRDAIPMKRLASRMSQVFGALYTAAVDVVGLAFAASVITWLVWSDRYADTWLGRLHDVYDRHPIELIVASLLLVTLALRLRAQVRAVVSRPEARHLR